MKKFLFIYLVLFPWLPALASHIVGGGVEYTCIGDRQWKITLKIFRECTGIPMCASNNCPQPMTARPSAIYNPPGCTATPASVNFNLNLVKVEDANMVEVQLRGPAAKNGCTNMGAVSAGSNNPSIEAYTFEGILNLNAPSLNSSTCAYWDVYWELCCRNAGINNLTVSSGQSFRIGCTINIFHQSTAVLGLKNNAPHVNNDILFRFCSGQEAMFNLAAIDADNDSLTYSLEPAKQAGGGPVNYQPPFSSNYPFPLNSTAPPHIKYPQPSGPYVIIDSLNGNITFNPVNNTPSYIFGNICIYIYQWGKNALGQPVLVGVTSRDYQLYVINCGTNTPPILSSIPSNTNGSFKTVYTVAVGDSLSIDITAKDADFYPSIQRYDTTKIVFIYKSDTLSSFTHNPGSLREDRGIFRYHARPAHLNTTQTFTLVAADNQAPTAFTSQQFIVRVVDGRFRINLGHQLTDSCRQQYRVSCFNDTNVQSVSWLISTRPNDFSLSQQNSVAYGNQYTVDNLSYPDTGRYLVRLSVFRSGISVPAFVYDTIIVTRKPMPPSLSNTSVCLGVSAQFSLPSGNYTWRIGGQSTVLSTSNMFSYQPQQRTTLEYSGTPAPPFVACLMHDSVIITIKTQPIFSLADTSLLCGGNSPVNVTNQTNQLTQYVWNDSILGPVRTFSQTGRYWVTLTQSNGCTASDTITVIPGSVPTTLFVSNDTSVCKGSSVLLSTGGANSYLWEVINNNSLITLVPRGTQQTLSVTPTRTTQYVITGFFNSTASGLTKWWCARMDTVTVTTLIVANVNAGSDRMFCQNNAVVNLQQTQHPLPTGGYFINSNNQVITSFNPATASIRPNKNLIIYHYAPGGSVCANQDTFYYEVSPAPVLQYIIGDSLPLKNTTKTYTTNANPFHNLIWMVTGGMTQSSGPNTINVLWTDEGVGNITVSAFDPVCQDVSINKTIQVQPITGLAEETPIQQLQLYPNPANEWVSLSFVAQEPTSVTLYNTALQLVYENHAPKGTVNMNVPLHNLSSGVYLIKIGTPSSHVTRKLVITR